MRSSHLVTYLITNAQTLVNHEAKAKADIAVTVSGNIQKDKKPLKGNKIQFTLEQISREGFEFNQDDNKRTTTLVVREFDKGRTVKEGNSASDNKLALTKILAK